MGRRVRAALLFTIIPALVCLQVSERAGAGVCLSSARLAGDRPGASVLALPCPALPQIGRKGINLRQIRKNLVGAVDGLRERIGRPSSSTTGSTATPAPSAVAAPGKKQAAAAPQPPAPAFPQKQQQKGWFQ